MFESSILVQYNLTIHHLLVLLTLGTSGLEKRSSNISPGKNILPYNPNLKHMMAAMDGDNEWYPSKSKLYGTPVVNQ